MLNVLSGLADFGSDEENENLYIEETWAKKKKDKSSKPRQAKNLVTLTPFENDLGRPVATIGVPTGGRKGSVGIGGGGDGGANREVTKTRTLTAPSRPAGELNLVPTTDVSKWAQGLEKYEQWEQVLATQEQELAADVHESRSIQLSTGKGSGLYVSFYHADAFEFRDESRVRGASLSGPAVVQRAHDRAKRRGHQEQGIAPEMRGRTAPMTMASYDEELAQQRFARMQQKRQHANRKRQEQSLKQPNLQFRLSKTLTVFDRHSRDRTQPIKKLEKARSKTSYAPYRPLEFRTSAGFFTEESTTRPAISDAAKQYMRHNASLLSPTARPQLDADVKGTQRVVDFEDAFEVDSDDSGPILRGYADRARSQSVGSTVVASEYISSTTNCYPMVKSSSAATLHTHSRQNYLQTHLSHANSTGDVRATAVDTVHEKAPEITLMGEPLYNPDPSMPLYQRLQRHVQSRSASVASSRPAAPRSAFISVTPSTHALARTLQSSKSLSTLPSSKLSCLAMPRTAKSMAVNRRAAPKGLTRALDHFECDYGAPTWGTGNNYKKVYKAQNSLKKLLKAVQI